MPLLRVQDVSKRYGTLHAVRHASFEIRAGEVLAILGPNGAGKSTLFECLAGLTSTDSGELVDGQNRPIRELERHALLLYLPDGIAPWREQRVDAVLRFAATLFGTHLAPGSDVEKTLGIGELRARRVGELSKGQRKRVLLAMVLAAPHAIVLLDEPFDGLDLRQTREAIALFRRVAADGRSLVLSIHAMTDAARVSDRMVLMNEGRTVAEGTLAELREHAGRRDGSLEEVFLALA